MNKLERTAAVGIAGLSLSYGGAFLNNINVSSEALAGARQAYQAGETEKGNLLIVDAESASRQMTLDLASFGAFLALSASLSVASEGSRRNK